MTEPTAIPSSEYDATVVTSLLRQEIRDFSGNLKECQLTHDQELRGGLIAWFCFFTPELVGSECSALLRECYAQNRGRELDIWYQLLPVEIALYGLTREEHWLNTHKTNLAYGGSLLRYYVMQSLSLAVPELYFDDEQMVRAVAYGLKVRYFGAEWGAAMLMVCKGDRQRKIALLQEWLRDFSLNRPDILRELAEGRMVEDAFFLPHFFRIQAYIIHRLCGRLEYSSEPVRPNVLFVGSLLEQIQRHPIMHGLIDFPQAELRAVQP